MFRDTISRDNGCPWGTTGMTSATWLDVSIQTVRICDLIATQPGIYLRPLIEQTTPVGGDLLPHVVLWQGQMYLEDGHHRVMRALCSGRQTIAARVLELPIAQSANHH